MENQMQASRYRNRSRTGKYRKRHTSMLPGILLALSLILVLSLVLWKICRTQHIPLAVTTVPTVSTSLPTETAPILTSRQKVEAYAHQHSIPLSMYPESILTLLEKNPETEQFVMEYPIHENIPLDMTAYQDMTGVPLFIQWNPMWGYEKYGSDVIGITGCGPTSLAMAGYYLTGNSKFNPANIAAFAEENGFYIEGAGSSWSLISTGGKKLGLDVREIPLDKNRILSNLEIGYPIITVVGPGDFTTDGHFMVMVAQEDGQIRVNDPNSLIRSQKLWSYEQLAPQIQNLWVICKP